MDKYNVSQLTINTILSWVENNVIAIPEIQRPFVWSTTQVRNLMDSLYQGYPVGYIITWQNPNVKLKDGREAEGKKILIDGQQRVTALRAAISGLTIVDKRYKEKRIIISFNPITEEFATRTPAIAKDPAWITDISQVMAIGYDVLSFVDDYSIENPQIDRRTVNERVNQLINIKSKFVGVIELSRDLDIDIVTEVFIRINASGVVLSSADFAMSKIATYEKVPGDAYGMRIRKYIDYFCQLSVAPEDYKHIVANDPEFASTEYFNKISWLKDEVDDLYDPTYNDMIRVLSLRAFERGKISDLVSLLSGRDFATRENHKELADQAFEKLDQSIGDFVNQNRYNHFIQNLRAAGYIERSMVPARNAVNYAYAVFLLLHSMEENHNVINQFVRRLFVLSNLTARHSGSFETVFESDVKRIKSSGIEAFVTTLEAQVLSDVFWNNTLVGELDKSNANNAFFFAFIAAQTKHNNQAFLTTSNTVRDLKTADIHHIFPKNFLAKHGKDKTEYNKIANFVFLRNDINVAISDKEPNVYLNDILSGPYGKYHSDIHDAEDLRVNMEHNCVPSTITEMSVSDYDHFLFQRRKLMASKIKDYYYGL